eukprot:s755_g12.t1
MSLSENEDGAEESAANLPPMLTAFPPFWGGGPSPCADDTETPDEISVPEEQEPPSGLPLFPDREADTSLPPFAFPNLASDVPESGPLASDYLAFQPTFDPTFDPTTSGTLCHWMMVDPSSECAMAVPIADQELPAVSMTILALDQRPVLKAEVYRGQECEPLPDFSPMIGDFWPPENVCLSSMERGTQRPSVVLTSLPMEIQRSEGDKENVADENADEDIQILSACYLVRADEQSLAFDIYNGNGEFFGRMGRDHSRSCRFMMRGGNFGEVRYFVDGVFEDHAVLFTDMCQDTLADGEPFEVSDLPFPEEGDKVLLKSSQGEIFEVEPEVACMSTLVRNMVDDSGTDEEIPLPNVKTAILSKVIDYCKYHKDSPPEEIQKPLKSTNLVECGVSEWDNEYVNIEQEVLFELILAANYLDIKSLLDLTCAKVASMIKGKNTEDCSAGRNAAGRRRSGRKIAGVKMLEGCAGQGAERTGKSPEAKEFSNSLV